MSGRTEFSPPAGSLAEREHRKWSESVVEMLHNPYTEEQVRIRDQMRKFSRTQQTSNFPADKRFGQDLMLTDQDTRKIDCGLKEIDADKYRRDFVINQNAEKKSTDENLLKFKWNTSMVFFCF